MAYGGYLHDRQEAGDIEACRRAKAKSNGAPARSEHATEFWGTLLVD